MPTASSASRTQTTQRPSRPRRDARRLPAWRRPTDWQLAGLFVLVSLVVRWPFRAQFLVNWDAVNFALGIVDFDLATHQPHPPGYLGFVAMGRAVNAVVGDPNTAMTLLSMLGGAAATGLVYLLARRFTRRRHAVMAAALYSTAPLVWYYSVVALSYMVTGAVALALLLACVTALQRRLPRHVYAASVLVAAIGALRPTDQLLLLPAWLVAVWAYEWRVRRRAAAVMVVASLAWFLPLMWLSGGLRAFLAQSSALADLAGTRTWVLGGNLAGMGQNLGLVGIGLALALFGGLVVLVAVRLRGGRPFGGLPTRMQVLLAAAVVPALLVYLLVHTGQLGYVILLLPTCYVGVARGIHQWAADPGRTSASLRLRTAARRLRSAASPSQWSQPATAVVVLVLVNTLGFLALPGLGVRAMGAVARAPVPPGAAELDDDSATAKRTRQYHVPANDRHWRLLVAAVDEFDPDTTAVIAETTTAGSFRHLSYYAPDHLVIGVGWDETNDLGYLFRAQDRRTNYAIERLSEASAEVVFPSDVTSVVIADMELAEAVLDTSVSAVSTRQLDDGSHYAVVRVSEPAGLHVANADDPDALEGREGLSEADHATVRTGLERVIEARASSDGEKPERVARLAFLPREALTTSSATGQGGDLP